MLTSDRPVNYLHWLEPDDTHILIEGGPVDYFIFHPDGRAEKITLGRDVAAGQRPLVAVPGGCWKALKLHDGCALCADGQCSVARIHSRSRQDRRGCNLGEALPRRRPMGHTRDLRALIGPNWIP